MKVRIKAREMKNVDPTWVSIVPAGANRAPFKIMKARKEGGMIDLKRIFKSEEPASMVAVLVRKGANLDAAKTRLGGAGLSIEKMSELEDATCFQQGDVEPQDSDTLVQFDQDLIGVFRNISKEFTGYESTTDFGKAMKAAGFYPGFMSATDVFRSTVFQAVKEAKNPAEAKSKVEAVVSDFSDYVADLVGALPKDAFRLDSLKSESTPPAPDPDPTPAPTPDPDPAAAPTPDPDPAATPEPDPAAAPAEGMIEMLKGIVTTAISDALAPVTAEIATLREGVAKNQADVAKAMEKVHKTAEGVKRTVFGTQQPDVREEAIKSEGAGLGLIDTANSRFQTEKSDRRGRVRAV